MIIIGGIKIPPIDELPENELKGILYGIINFAKSNPQGPEREAYDFKRQLNINDKGKYEIRKDFSSFANTRGGLIIVGVDEKQDCKIVGVQDIPKDDQLSQILSTKGYINPPVRFSSRVIPYQGKTVLLYYVPESDVPIEIRKEGKSWGAHGRVGGITKLLSNIEITLKFYRGIRKLPERARINISQLGFYSPEDDSREPLRWSPSSGQNRGYVKIGSRYSQGVCC